MYVCQCECVCINIYLCVDFYTRKNIWQGLVFVCGITLKGYVKYGRGYKAAIVYTLFLASYIHSSFTVIFAYMYTKDSRCFEWNKIYDFWVSAFIYIYSFLDTYYRFLFSHFPIINV